MGGLPEAESGVVHDEWIQWLNELNKCARSDHRGDGAVLAECCPMHTLRIQRALDTN